MTRNTHSTTSPTRREALRRSSRMTVAWLVALLGAWVAVGAQAAGPKKIEGHTFAGEVKVGDATVVLNGVGVRQVAWLKGYACALYLPKETTSQSQALAMPGAKRVSMRLLIDAPSEEFAKAFVRGVNRNALPAELPAMKERIQAFDTIVRGIGKLKKGDWVEVDWRPGQGTVAVVNGRVVGQPVPGDDIYTAMLKIYIGDKPTDDTMRLGLLGLSK